MTNREVTGLGWALPDDWLAWHIGDLLAVATAVAALGDNADSVRAMAAAATEFDAFARAELPGTTCAAIWVPSACDRRPHASAALRIASVPASDRMSPDRLMAFVRDVPRSRRTRTLDIAVARRRLEPGEGVLRIVDRAPRLTRRVSREWTWYILPTGTDDLIACQVESSSVAHFDALADMTTDIANSIEITLEPV